MTDTTDPQTAEPELTETQKAYNVAQHEMFQLAAYGHCTYTPRAELLTAEGKAEQADYNNRIRKAREELEAAVLRLVAEHAQTCGSSLVSVDWLRSMAAPAALSLLAVPADELEPAAGPVLSVLPPDGRAAVLSGADRQFLTFALDLAADQMASRGDEFNADDEDAMERLRRLADEQQPGTTAFSPGEGVHGRDPYYASSDTEAQQQAETQAHPAEHTWAAELHDPLTKEWVPGTRYLVRDRAVNALAHARSIGPTWRDGTPTERRLVRATTTYTVETPAAAPVAGQPPADTTGEEADRG